MKMENRKTGFKILLTNQHPNRECLRRHMLHFPVPILYKITL